MRCTPFDPFVDTETMQQEIMNGRKPRCTPFDPFVDTTSTARTVAPPSIRLWILKHFLMGRQCIGHSTVAPPSIRLWILKLRTCHHTAGSIGRCTPFDPFVDTETRFAGRVPLQRQRLHPLRSVCGY